MTLRNANASPAQFSPRSLSKDVAADRRTFHLGLSLGAAAVVSIGVLGTLATGCGNSAGSQEPHAQSLDRQSDAEYDVALDLMSKNDPHRALQHVQKSLAMNEDNAHSLYLESDIYLSFCVVNMASPDCRLDKAEDDAKRAVKADDGFREAKNLLGQVYILEKKYAEAIAVLTPLTKDQAYAYPHLAWGNLGWAQVLSGDLDHGIASLKNAVTQPQFCVGFYRLGVAYEKKNDWAQAEQSFSSAVGVDNPECKRLQDAWEERGRARMQLSHNDDAKADLEQCRDIAPQTATGRACVQMLNSGNFGATPSSNSTGGTSGSTKP